MGFSSSLIGAPPLSAAAAPLEAATPNQMGFSSSLIGAPPMVPTADVAPPMSSVPPVPAATTVDAASPPADAPGFSQLSAPPMGEMVAPPAAYNAPPTIAAAPPVSSLLGTFAPPPMAVVSPPRGEAAPPPMAVFSAPASLAPLPISESSPVAANPPSLGPPDLVDHRPNTSQPELVSNTSQPE